jgi:TetR/AcrR family transcriptional regulator
MTAVIHKSRLGTRGQPEQTRAAILQAAVREFAREGIAGARTDAIARGARVNKALLYYYFKDKEALYAAALDHVFSQRNQRLLEVLRQAGAPKQRICNFVTAYFDYLAGNPAHRDLVQREMMRASRGDSPHILRIAKRYIHPVYTEVAEVLREGIAAGEFRPVDPLHFVPSMIAVVIFYFSSAPVMRLVTQEDPLAPERLAERRAAVLDFVSAALMLPAAPLTQGAKW